MRHRRGGLTLAWVLLVFVLSSGFRATADTAADERAELQRVRAAHLAATGRCEDALALTTDASSRDAATELMIGKCAVQSQNYGRALEALDRARALDADLAGVELYRGMSLYHLEDYDAARDALENARVEGEEVALLEFYRGLLFLRADEPRESALAFERAAARGPELVEPVASYYAALAWQSLNENEPLESAVDRVREEDPSGPWADEADRLVELQAERHRAGQTGLQRWAGFRIGQEYDDNVTLLGGDGEFRVDGIDTEFDFEEDWRTVWSAHLGAEFLEVDDWTFAAQASYAGSAHDDLDIFDQHYVTAMFWADHEIRATTFARLQTTFGAGWIDEEPFLYHLNFAGLLEERWGRPGTTRCELGTQLYDFRYDLDLIFDQQYGDRLDEDGAELNLGCTHEVPLTVLRVLEPDFYGGYRFSYYFSEGEEWEHTAHGFHLGLRLMLPLEIEFDVRGTYTRRDFSEASYFAEEATVGPKRDDDAVQADVSLRKDLTDFLALETRYQYLDNGSNTEPFDYERHTVGVYLELEFP